ncbi:GGDEF domain-containing protein [Idiomarina loihiensis]|uniref:sensor domain-containing protein n=1 Tax=Idiomarina loihiensis TaxID=135577 RepID=UPI00129CCEB4|nr:sensor domain-containing diguanylate cyclase [Idiomarina loihiensis]MRJ45682.1 diguanylate cyclase [Idiomarina loihiensis]UTW32877.1 GGDEF domain-containing protein [Idiomarina loihiensis]
MNKTAFADLAKYMDLLLDAICVVNKQHQFSYLSPGSARVFGYAPEEMIGRSMFDFMHPDDHQATLAVAQQINAGEQIVHFENRYIRKDGSIVYLLWSARWSERDQMRVGVARDISEQKRLEHQREALISRLEHMALTDPLTQLPNRALFYDRVSTSQKRAERDSVGLGLLYLDLDKFKHINDAHGHATGDQLLKGVAERIAFSIRATDTVARLGGDEFVVLIDAIPTTDEGVDIVRAVADKIRQAMQTPLMLPHGEEVITASIGMALWPKHGDTVDALINHADQAMYQAKRDGGNRLSE